MKLYFYGGKDGLSVTLLPHEVEGQIVVLHPDENGKPLRLLDIEGNGADWTAYSTPFGMINYEGQELEELTLKEGLSFFVTVHGQRFTILCKNYSASQSDKVQFYRFPDNEKIIIGDGDCDILCSHSVIKGRQVSIAKTKDMFQISALSQTPGVYVDYRYIQDAAVPPGSIIDIFGLRVLLLDGVLAVNAHSVYMTVSGRLKSFVMRRSVRQETPHSTHLMSDSEFRYDRSPRVALPEEIREISIEPPPPAPESEEMPLIFSVGSSAFMSMSSVMMAMNSISNAQATGAAFTTVLPSVFMAGGMFVGSMLMPIFTRKYMKKKTQEQEKQRQKKYLEYLSQADTQIAAQGEKQKTGLNREYPVPEELYKRAESADDLWSHMPFHHDFLRLRLGTANIAPEVTVTFPKHSFHLNEDVMRRALEDLENKRQIVDQMPLMLSLKDTGVLGILGEHEERMKFLKSLLIQLCTYHSYREMKLVFIYNKSEEREWEFVRWFPHVWSDNGEFRAIGTDRDAMRNISAYIDAICPMNERETNQEDNMCVVVLADSSLSEQCFSLTERLKHIERSSLRVIAIANEANTLPKECRSVVVLEGDRGVLNKNIEKVDSPILFDLDPVPLNQVRPFASVLFNTHLNDADNDGKLVDMITLFDMLRCGNVDQINAPERWKNSNPVKTLAAPLGLDKYGALLSLDIHQNAHGPHGLIAGMTGSGKSEFIITYLLSMAINYSPLEVGFILIDYKGGGMSDTLAQLPHVVGVIDNLGGSQGIHRALVSIKSEILRRQFVFKEISEKKHVSNMDIYKYQAMYRNGELSEPMQHLILVSDEFAELKEQESGFMDDIVSMARIGRSLGIHLILATQKPTGVVSPQIASNARFHVCLKVQDKGDSMEILGRPEAALLTKTGRFYLQVGFNEVFVLGQSAWSGALSAPKPRYVEEPDQTFEMLNDLGETIAKAKPPHREKAEGVVKQVDAVVAYLRREAEALNLMPQKSWRPSLTALIQNHDLLLDEIDEEFSPVYTPYAIDPVIGLADDPKQQDQYPLQLNLTEKGNVIVYGFAGAGKTEVVNAVIYSLCKHHTADELHIYCLDFSSESSRMFSAMPQMGDVIVSGEDEKIENFIRMMSEEMDTRRKTLASFGGSIEIYRKETGAFIPNILILVQNYPAFSEAYDKLEDGAYKLIREGNRFGIYFIITSLSNSGVRYRLAQNFKQVLCLQMTDRMDYTNLIGKTEGTEPMDRLGSGIYRRDYAVEFQTAFIFPSKDENTYKKVQQLSMQAATAWQGHKAPRVPTLPEHVTLSDVSDMLSSVSMTAVPIGIDKMQMMPSVYDFSTAYLTPVLYSMLPEIPWLQLIGEMLAQNVEREVVMLDIGRKLVHSAHPSYRLIIGMAEAEKEIDRLFDITVLRHNETKQAELDGRPAPRYSELVILIVGPKDLFDQLRGNKLAGDKLDGVLLKGRCDLGMYAVLLQDVRYATSLSMHSWYGNIPDRDGIWLGDGIQMQNVLKTDVTRRDPGMNDQFGYLVQRGKARLVKLIEER